MNERVDPVTPRGFRDIWGGEAAERDALATAMLEAAARWGYLRVETPVLERAETLAAGAGAAMEGDAFRLFDLDGGLLALRPEMTVPIARLVASRLATEPGPQRLAYAADVFREHASYRGQYRQFTQVGVELVGPSSASADAECVALAAEMLEGAGLSDFDVALGDVGVLRALLGASGQKPVWQEAVMAALHDRNLVELDTLSGGVDIEAALRRALQQVPRLRGGFETLDAAGGLLGPCGCAQALDGLRAVRGLLGTGAIAACVSVDFGIVRAFEYYTGLMLEASAPGMGLPLGGGGRYDGLLGKFGRPMAAAGFAFTLERVHIALAEQGGTPVVPGIDAVLGGPDDATVFATAQRLRAAGERIAIVPGERAAVRAKAAALGAVRALWADGTELVSLVEEGAS